MEYKSQFFITFLLLFFLGQTVYARGYAVEVIIFEQVKTNEAPVEAWDFSINRVAGKLEKLQTLATKSVEIETSSTLTILSAARRNLNASGYRILRTAKWVQPALVYQNAPVIDLGIPETTLPSGFIRIYKTSLIFAEINLHLVPLTPLPATALQTGSTPFGNTLRPQTEANNRTVSDNNHDSSIGNQPPQYFLSEKRRLKFKEVHYFDHPRFGVILGVWPTT